MVSEIVGRDEELAAVSAFVERPADGLAALVLSGDAGIGKSTLWLAGVTAARQHGLRVLGARPAEAEQGLAHAGLADLLDGAVDDVLTELTTPQRRALEIALLIEDANADVPDPRALGAAVRSALRLLAEREPLLLAIDDAHWLDQASAGALEFALRRLDNEPVKLLLARRGGAASLERALDGERGEEVAVRPLSAGAVHALLRIRLGKSFPRPTLRRIHDTSGGNPFYALELARALDRRGGAVPGDPLPVPETLQELVRDRLAALPDETRRVLLTVAALAEPTMPVLRAIDRAAAKLLEPAVHADVIEVDNDEARFTHPLLASVLYAEAPAAVRRSLHAQLAATASDPVERARHLGLSAEEPGEETAARLEEASRVASSRGAPGHAAELAEQAVRLTPAEHAPAADRRARAAVRAHLAAGDGQRARAIARDLAAAAGPGVRRAESLRLLAEVEGEAGDLKETIRLLREALEHAAEQPGLQAAIHQSLGATVRMTEGVRAAERHAKTSLELADRAGDEMLRAAGLSLLALLRFNAGRAGALPLAEEACELGGSADPELRARLTFNLAHVLLWSCEFDRARPLLEGLHRDWSERDEPVSANALWYLTFVELRTGRWERATELAARVVELSDQYDVDSVEPSSALIAPAFLAVHRGALEEGRALAERGRRATVGEPALRLQYEGVLGWVELWQGDAAAAAEHFAAAEAAGHAAELLEPVFYDWRDAEVEALLQLERLDEAEALIDNWEAVARRVGRQWVLAKATRCRGLLAAARGDVDQATTSLEAAVAEHEAAGDSFGRARTLLALGVTRRRVRQKRAAREAIEAALAGFERLGAVGWAEIARTELGRIGGRTRAEGLTAAEQRVAQLVAAGRTNREVAAALFLGERTVETHLSHVYAKLGIRSRTELARTLR